MAGRRRPPPARDGWSRNTTPGTSPCSTIPRWRPSAACRIAASWRMHRPAVTRIRGLPVRRCSAWCCCRIRYPATLSTASPPQWLTAHFEAAQDALRDRPCRSQLLQDRPVKSPFVISFEASVIADRSPCTQLQGNKSKAKSKSGPFDGKIPTLWQCTADDNVIWAGAVLWHYAVAVDRAVEHVRLHSSILGFLRCPYFMTIFRLTSPLHNG